jgi:hypothetical protein
MNNCDKPSKWAFLFERGMLSAGARTQFETNLRSDPESLNLLNTYQAVHYGKEKAAFFGYNARNPIVLPVFRGNAPPEKRFVSKRYKSVLKSSLDWHVAVPVFGVALLVFVVSSLFLCRHPMFAETTSALFSDSGMVLRSAASSEEAVRLREPFLDRKGQLVFEWVAVEGAGRYAVVLIDGEEFTTVWQTSTTTTRAVLPDAGSRLVAKKVYTVKLDVFVEDRVLKALRDFTYPPPRRNSATP